MVAMSPGIKCGLFAQNFISLMQIEGSETGLFKSFNKFMNTFRCTNVQIKNCFKFCLAMSWGFFDDIKAPHLRTVVAKTWQHFLQIRTFLWSLVQHCAPLQRQHVRLMVATRLFKTNDKFSYLDLGLSTLCLRKDIYKM